MRDAMFDAEEAIRPHIFDPEYFQGAATFYRQFNLLLALDYERRQAEALKAHRAGNPQPNNMQCLTDFADQLQAWAAEIHARVLHHQGTQAQRKAGE
jgi:hypothetical protein